MPVEAPLEDQAFRIAIGQAKNLIVTLEEAVAGGVAAWDMRFRLRTKAGQVLVTKSSGSGITIVEAGADGVALPSWQVSLTSADTAGLYPGQPDWSLWDRAAGQENPVAVGIAHVYRTADLPEPA